jgi:hypothetical protein
LSMIVKRSWWVFLFSVCSSLMNPFPYFFIIFGLTFGATTTLARQKELMIGPVDARSVEKAVGFARPQSHSVLFR